MSKLKILGHILAAIPAAVILIVGLISFYVYYAGLYELTLSTPITFIVIFALWVLGLKLKKDEK